MKAQRAKLDSEIAKHAAEASRQAAIKAAEAKLREMKRRK
jgi:hypothetical protein